MSLPSDLVDRLEVALLDAFPDDDALDQLVRRVGMHARVPARAALAARVSKLLDVVDAQGRVVDLLDAALDLAPGNVLLGVVRPVILARLAKVQAAPLAREVAAIPPPIVPEPAYQNAEVQALTERLEGARTRREILRGVGIATDEVEREILDLRRTLREGGQVRAGDALGDGRYLLVRQLGHGGFAVVWEAYDRTERRRVAVKVLHQHLANEPQRRERFFRGARVMMELRHPGVTRVYDPRGEDDAFCYFVMELMPGGNLRDAVLGQRIEPGRSWPLILQVVDALAEAHRKQLVHRDVKPANILLDEHGTAKLSDFDLVGAHDTTGGTRDGAMGTFVYAAPECLDKPQEATARADVFSLGMTAIFCLSGQELSKETFRNPAAAARALDCSVSLQGALERAVSWEPSARFADAAEMTAAIRGALAGAVGSSDHEQRRDSDALVAELSDEPADRRSNDRRQRARRVLSDARERWLEQERSERRLLDLGTVIELIPDIDSNTLSAEMTQFIDESAAFSVDGRNDHTLAILGFIRSTEALVAPYTRFTRLLQHTSPRVRRGAVSLVREFDRHVATRVLSEHVAVEQDAHIRRVVVSYLRGVGISPSFDTAEKLLAAPSDWMTAAWALTATPERPAALLLGDGTAFARDMGRLAADAGFRVVDEQDRSLFLHGQLEPKLLELYAVVVVIRGENYFRSDDDHDYRALAQYAKSGGTLFMTPWVAWETVQRPFAAILPFRHLRNSHNEGVTLLARATAAQPAHELFSETFSLEASYEELSPCDDTTVLLVGDGEIPLYGFRRIENGECHYLNICQHNCLRPMSSPLQSHAFSRAMKRTWQWLYQRCPATAGPAGRARGAIVYFAGHGAPDLGET